MDRTPPSPAAVNATRRNSPPGYAACPGQPDKPNEPDAGTVVLDFVPLSRVPNPLALAAPIYSP